MHVHVHVHVCACHVMSCACQCPACGDGERDKQQNKSQQGEHKNKRPHDGVLAAWADAMRAPANAPVVHGDKEKDQSSPGDHLGSPRGRVGRPIRLLAGGRRRLRDFGRTRRLQPSRAAPAGSWGRRAVGPTPYASRSELYRGVKVGRVSDCAFRTGSGGEPAGPAEAVCPSTVDPVMA